MKKIINKKRKEELLWTTNFIQFVVILYLLFILIFFEPVVKFNLYKPSPVNITQKWYYTEESEISSMPLGQLINFSSLNITGLMELETILISSGDSIIKAISQSQYSQKILTMDDTGIFFSFDLFTNEKNIIFDFNHKSLINAEINEANSVVMMTFRDQESKLLFQEVWDLGSLRKIIDSNNLMLKWENYYLVPSGEYAVVYDYDYPSMFMIDDFNTNTTIETDIPLAKEKDHLSSISGAAGDQFGDYLAVAFQNGKIIIGNIEEGDFLDGGLLIDDIFIDNSVNVTRDLFFSYNNQYLVWLTEDEVVVWLLNNQTADLILREKVSSGNVAAVDRSGHWLVVGTEDSLIFYDLEKQYASYQENGEVPNTEPERTIETSDSVRSIFFSLDNTMLFWGDDEGQVHIWGAIEE